MVKEKLAALWDKFRSSNRARVTAFLTLAMLIMMTSHHGRPVYIDKNLPPLDTNINHSRAVNRLEPIVQLFRNGRFYCTAFVIGNNYALTASHCLMSDDGMSRTDDEIDIRLNNKKTGIIAKAVGVEFRRDLGLIKGDFSSFQMIEVSNDSPGFMANEPLIACGYPGGNKHVSCTTFQPAINDAFFLRGPGILVGGMSGGPVINIITSQAVGVNCHVYESETGGGVGISTLYGVLGRFGIEP
jgi:hypothetical protein